MKLKLEMPLKNSAFRFGVSLATVPRVFFNLDDCFRHQTFTISVLAWSREHVEHNATVFSGVFFRKKVTVIIDCFEVFINRPSGLYVRTQTISSYKNHYTEKFWLESHLRAVFLLFPKLGVEEHQTNSWLRIVVS